MTQDSWHIAERGTSKGPFTTLEMEALIARGEVRAETLIWNETLPVWESAALHFEFGAAARPQGRPAVPGMPAAPGMQGGDLGPDGLYVGAPSRGFGEALRVCFSKYVTFSGRASRSEYWYFMVWQLLIGFVTGFIDGFFGALTGFAMPVNIIASLVLFLPALSVTWRRLHDIDRSGWWVGGFYLALFVFIFLGAFSYGLATGISGSEPGAELLGIFAILGVIGLIYAIVVLVFLCTRGTPGPNKYG